MYAWIVAIALAPAWQAKSDDAVSHEPHKIALSSNHDTGFLENKGQWPEAIQFAKRISGMTLGLRSMGFDVCAEQLESNNVLSGTSLSFDFVDALDTIPRGENPLPGRHSYFNGSDAKRWTSNSSAYETIRYDELYPGIDLVWHRRKGPLEYDFHIEPGSDLARILIDQRGADSMKIDGDGALIFETSMGALRQSAPKAWEIEASGQKREVTASFVLLEDARFGFNVEGWSGQGILVIDPNLEWSTFLGGQDGDWVYQIETIDDDLLVSGSSRSFNFPTTPGAFRTYSFSFDAFLTRLKNDASEIVYSCRLGGVDFDLGFRIRLDSQDRTVFVGRTRSHDFPVTADAFQQQLSIGAHGFQADAFISIFSEDGSQLIYSTFFGGTDFDWAYAMALAPDDSIWFAGQTMSTDFLVTADAFQSELVGDFDAFVAHLDPTRVGLDQCMYSTYLGGSEIEFLWELLPNPDGTFVAVGITGSEDFPTTANALDPTHNGDWDIFVSKLDPSSTVQPLVWSTYVGGVNRDEAFGAVLHPSGDILLGGWTCSPNYPTTQDAFSRQLNGHKSPGVPSRPGLIPMDVCLTRVAADGGSISYSTLIGGYANEQAWSLDLDSRNVVSLIGRSHSPNYPTTSNAYDRTYGGKGDMIITQFDLSAPGNPLVYSSYMGGAELDEGYAVESKLVQPGAFIVGGFTGSQEFPTTPGVVQETFADQTMIRQYTSDTLDFPFPPQGDGFLAKFVPSGFHDGHIPYWTVDSIPEHSEEGLSMTPLGPIVPGKLTVALEGPKEHHRVVYTIQNADALGCCQVFETELINGKGTLNLMIPDATDVLGTVFVVHAWTPDGEFHNQRLQFQVGH